MKTKYLYLLCATLCSSLAAKAQVSFSATSVNVPNGNNRATVDMNGDYLDDIVCVNYTAITVLYQQANGTFSQSTYPISQLTYAPDWSMAIGDWDKNGFNDMLFGGGGGVSMLKANATGTDFTENAYPQYIFCQRGNFTDINNDGHLDAFMCHDVDTNVYFINDGNGNLVYHKGGIGNHPEGGNYGSIWVDYDNDGDADCFIAKCRGGWSTASIDELHRNNGDGTFTEVAVAANLDNAYHQSWSSAWNDFDNDGDMDVLIGQSAGDGSILKRNNGDGTFTDITAGSGWQNNGGGNSVEFVSYDMDNNGFADVLINGGYTIMYNNGDMTFTESSTGSMGKTIGDLNNDGFLDLFDGYSVRLNNGNNNHWIKVQIKGIASNSNGIGARIELYGSWGKQIRDIQSGTGFANMNTLNAHFGIGSATSIDSIRVLWPSGTINVVKNPDANSSVTIVEGGSSVSLLETGLEKPELYPNPVSDELHLLHIEQLHIQSLTITDIRGNVLLIKQGNYSTTDVSHLPEGMYVLKLETDQGTATATFIRKN